MQREENSNSYSRKTWRGVDSDKLNVILSVLLYIFLSAFSPFFSSQIPLSSSILLNCLLSAILSSPHLLSCTSIFQHPGTPFSCCLFFIFSPCRHFCCQCQLCCLVYCCNKSSAPFISCHLCCRELDMCALSSPLSPLTATSPLYHRPADQIRSELGQETQCWINGRWPWVGIYWTDCSSWNEKG